jgi:hypothetical protein
MTTYTVKLLVTDDQTGEQIFDVDLGGLDDLDPVYKAAGAVYGAAVMKAVKEITPDEAAKIPFAGA